MSYPTLQSIVWMVEQENGFDKINYWLSRYFIRDKKSSSHHSFGSCSTPTLSTSWHFEIFVAGPLALLSDLC
jgi:hypothetical protein